jgi:hypothetical protein
MLSFDGHHPEHAERAMPSSLLNNMALDQVHLGRVLPPCVAAKCSRQVVPSAAQFVSRWSSSAGVSSRVARIRGAIAASAAKAGKNFPMMLSKDSGENDNPMPFSLGVAKITAYRWKKRHK